jgi:hypothetical protein
MDQLGSQPYEKQNECTMNPSRLVVNVPLKLRRAMLHLTLDFYIIIAWNMLTTKVFLVTVIGPQC